MDESRPPLPPFTPESAAKKVRLAEDVDDDLVARPKRVRVRSARLGR